MVLSPLFGLLLVIACSFWGIIIYHIHVKVYVSPKRRKPPDKNRSCNDCSRSMRERLVIMVPEEFCVFTNVFRVFKSFLGFPNTKYYKGLEAKYVILIMCIGYLIAGLMKFILKRKKKPPDKILQKNRSSYKAKERMQKLYHNYFKQITKGSTQDLSMNYCIPCSEKDAIVMMAKLDDNKRDVSQIFQEMVKLIVDSGASRACSQVKEDFISFKSLSGTKIGGIADGLQIEGEGVVRYQIKDDNHKSVNMEVNCYYIPTLPNGMRLISPQDIQTDKKQTCVLIVPPLSCRSAVLEVFESFHKEATSWREQKPVHKVPIPYNPKNNLPELVAWVTNKENDMVLNMTRNVLSEENENLNRHQKELLRWHNKLGHIGFKQIQWMIRVGWIKVKGNPKLVSNCKIPKCLACCLAKACCRPTKATKIKLVEEKQGSLKKNVLFPGQVVASDHYMSSVPGRLYSSRGSTPSERMYHGGTIFVDNATGLIDIEHQVSLSANDTIKAKLKFEEKARESGVSVQAYHTDNGVFTSEEFLSKLSEDGQKIKFSGVGAAHQNGVAERAIKTIVTMARTMMIHAALNSPEGAIDMSLWPMAMDHATWIYNRIPRMENGISPISLWARTMENREDNMYENCHVWGCPTYVLEPKLQKSGIKIPKWQPRSRCGINLGFSKMHSTMVGLILNRRTGSISPQFHVIYDDWFTTVCSGEIETPQEWHDLISMPSARLQVILDESDEAELEDEWLTDTELQIRNQQRQRKAQTTQRYQRQETEYTQCAPNQEQTKNDKVQDTSNGAMTQESKISERDGDEKESQDLSSEKEDVPTESEVSTGVRRSARIKKKPAMYNPGNFEAAKDWVSDQSILIASYLSENRSWKEADWDEILGLLVELDQVKSFNKPPTTRITEAFALLSKKHYDPDTPNYWQAMSGENAEEYQKAMKEEIDSLVKRKTWSIVERSKIGKKQVWPLTWAYKCKRRPDGSIRKYKARCCVRGDIQKKKSDEKLNTYAPVASWTTIRLMLILTCILQLETLSVDFSNAFAQADIPNDSEVYIEVPKDFESVEEKDIVLRLHKALYGQAEAPRLWYEKLKAGLEKRGIKATIADPCLFISENIICIVYVDDCLFFARDKKKIHDLLKSFTDDGDKYNWEHTVEGDVSEYLGIEINKIGNDAFQFVQTGLIDKILRETKMMDCNSKATPTNTNGPLGTNSAGEEPRREWNYASIIGMMLYLSLNSRPDITFAVHQCARFTHKTKRSHEEAVLRIVRYLKGTRKDGLIFKPTKDNLAVDCYCDADFAGLWGYEDSQDPVCVKSRTGYIITIANCPLLWVSKLQTEIALSTLHAEYVALSQSLRDLLPVKTLVKTILEVYKIDAAKIKYTTKSEVFEDNQGALTVAQSPRFTPTSKFIAVKYHWFRSHVNKEFELVKVESKLQKADIFTKAMNGSEYTQKRKLTCGW